MYVSLILILLGI